MRDAEGRVASLAGRALTVRIPLIRLPAAPQSGVLTVGSARYLLNTDRTGSYLETTFVPGIRVEDIQVDVLLELDGGRRRSGTQSIRLLPLGIIHEQTLLARNEKSLEGVSVQILRRSGGTWIPVEGGMIGQANPFMTLRGGGYGYVVPNGSYQVRVSKEGHRGNQQVRVKNVLNARIGMKMN